MHSGYHLGDLNKFLPTLHGFDEFFGYLYHLDAMSDPYWYSFPIDQNFYNQYATDTDDATVMPRWGKVGKQGSSMKGRCRHSQTCRMCRTCTTCRS